MMIILSNDERQAEFIQPKNVFDLTDVELDAEIAARQIRRLAAFRIYSEQLARTKEARDERLKARMAKELKGFEKDLASIDKNIQKCRDRLNKIRGIRLELDDTFDINAEEKI